MGRVCYTQVGSCEFQIFTLAAGNSCVCVHFPQPASRISSRCQLHFPVANCILRFTPSPIFFVPQPPNLAPKPFLLSEQTALSFGKERTRTFLSRSTAVQRGAGEAAAVLSENQSPFAELQCTPRPPPAPAFYVKLELELFGSFGKRQILLVFV